MKKMNLLLTILVALTVMSFKTKPPSKKLNFKTGIYGVCNCNNSESSEYIKLTINEDFTFHYLNNSNPNKKVDINGNWISKNNTIILKNYNSDFAIHNKWTIDKNEKSIKSRNRLNFTRLSHLKFCNEKN
ncbi:MAG: hypothetical protein H0V01_04545 [Bacteroidetes bacterium]|nr:hypothetical protein [Bacteroidota bacterium]HET6244832.1 hypothetical protein [Bacteroidia bacterium]